MWCPECNESGGCDCHITKGIKYIPPDHEKELERWLADLSDEITNDRNHYFNH